MSTDRLTRNADYSERVLSAQEKRTLCAVILDKKMTITGFCKAHNLKQPRVSRWMNLYKEEIKDGIVRLHDDGGGRPSVLDSASMEDLGTWVRNTKNLQQCATRAKFNNKLKEVLGKVGNRNGVANGRVEVSKKTVTRLYKKMSIKGVKPQKKTNARIRNEYDLRNSYSMIAMVWAFAEFLDPNMMYNWDATQFAIEKDSVGDVLVIKGEDDHVPPTIQSSGETGIAIKYIHFHNSAGDVAPAVYLIADCNMGENEVHTQSIAGLGNGAELGSLGWLCICKTRQANTEFYKWFARTIVVPFVTSSRIICENKNPDGTDMRAFVTCDGEEAQIKVFQEEGMLSLFKEALIDFGKTPASCSAICQSSDVSSFFKAMKASIKGVDDHPWRNVSLHKKLKAALQARQNCGISACNQSKLIEGLQKIAFCMQKVVNKEIIKNGYIRCGQDAPIGLDIDGKPTMDKFYAQMRLCTAKITKADMELLVHQFPEMVKLMRENGTVTEAQMDALNIPNFNEFDSDSKAKDERALHKQRAVIMNMQDCISKYKRYHQVKVTKSRSSATKTRQAAATKTGKTKKRKLNIPLPSDSENEPSAKRNSNSSGKKKSSFEEIHFSDESQDEDESALPNGVPNPYYNRFENDDYTI
jgi:hypothetical protein